MVRTVLSFCISVMLASVVLAQDTGLRRMDTGDQAAGWEAVGRLELNGARFCTGALIAPDLVLTAAHCLYNPTTGALLRVDEIEFRAGWRNGRAEAYRTVRAAAQHPDYIFGADKGPERVMNDLAILQLHHPIRSNAIKPFDTVSGLRHGETVSVVSYAHDRAEAPSVQDVCRVMGEETGIYLLSCDVDYGSSGAPVFIQRAGELRIASVVSAKATYEQEPVALASVLGGPLERVMAELAKQPQLPSVRRLGGSGTISQTGAKTVRP